MQTKNKHLLLRILLVVTFVLVGCIAIFELLIRQYNHLSPEFRAIAKPAFEAIRQCEPSTGQSASVCGVVLETAENQLPMLHAAARSQGDRRAAYLIQATCMEPKSADTTRTARSLGWSGQ